MSTQPEALRLADAIDNGWLENVDSEKVGVSDIQTELRRLHAVNREMLNALSEITNAMDAFELVPAINEARELLRKLGK